MSVRMRHTRSHTKNRRSHHALSEPRLSLCASCQKYYERHRACLHCGEYRGRQVIDMTRKNERLAAKRKAREEANK